MTFHQYVLIFNGFCQQKYLLTNILIPWSRGLPQKLTGPQLVTKFLAFYGTRMFIMAFTTPVPVLSQTDPLDAPNFNIILPSKPGSSKWSPSLTFPHQNPICTSPLPHMCYILLPGKINFKTSACMILSPLRVMNKWYK